MEEATKVWEGTRSLGERWKGNGLDGWKLDRKGSSGNEIEGGQRMGGRREWRQKAL